MKVIYMAKAFLVKPSQANLLSCPNCAFNGEENGNGCIEERFMTTEDGKPYKGGCVADKTYYVEATV